MGEPDDHDRHPCGGEGPLPGWRGGDVGGGDLRPDRAARHPPGPSRARGVPHEAVRPDRSRDGIDRGRDRARVFPLRRPGPRERQRDETRPGSFPRSLRWDPDPVRVRMAMACRVSAREGARHLRADPRRRTRDQPQGRGVLVRWAGRARGCVPGRSPRRARVWLWRCWRPPS
jgi:hypothetical protein